MKIEHHDIHRRFDGTYELEVRYRVALGLQYQFFTGFNSELEAESYFKSLQSCQ